MAEGETQAPDPGIIGFLIGQVTAAIADIVERIEGAITGAMSSVGGALSEIANTIRVSVASAFDQITGFFNGLIDRITSALGSVIDTVTEWIGSAMSTVVDSIRSFVSDGLDFFQSIYDRVAGAISDLYTTVTNWLEEVFNTFSRQVVSLVEQVQTYFNNISEYVANRIAAVIDAGSMVVNEIKQAISEFVSSVVDVVGSSLRDLLETISELPDELQQLGDTLLSSAKENVAEPLTNLWNNFHNSMLEMLAEGSQQDAEQLGSIAKQLLTGERLAATNREEWGSLFREFFPNSPASRFAANMLIGVIVLIQAGSGIAQAQSRLITQEFNSSFPTEILSVGDAVHAKWRQLYDDGETKSIMAKHGYGPSDAAQIEEILRPIPQLQELMSWYTRGLIDEDRARYYLNAAGYNEESQQAFLTNAYFIPPAGDLITMAVREAFSPEIAESFGQFEDFPTEFEEYASQSGIAPEWAKRYWAAHWGLPSAQMGFEMLHRGVIDEQDLNFLLRALDIMPFWRDKITAISYKPYTRVDVRRMHALGILDRDDVLRSYLDLGYDPEKAENMTKFTEEYNKSSSLAEGDDLVGLQRSSIIRFYSNGILNRADARGLLKDIGYSDWVADMYITQADLDLELDNRKEQISLILDKVRAGLVSFGQAQDALYTLGLEDVEVQRAMAKVERERIAKTQLPSRSDLDRMVKADIIDDGEYLATMALHGYSDVWAHRYLKLARS